METVLFGSFLMQYDAIKANFMEMKPFLNINEYTGSYFYRSIFILKILFVVYAFDRVVDKHLSLVFKLAGNLCSACKNPIFRDILLNILSAFVIFLLYKETLTSTLSEFIIDIFILTFSLQYAVEAYKKELQKMSSIIFICLFVQWSVNQTASTEHFKICTYFQVLSLLFLSYLPMMPNNPKYKHKLTYFYLLMSIWVFYKLCQHYDGHYVMHQNSIKGAIEEDKHTKLEPERGKLDDALKNLDVNNESICCDAGNLQSPNCTPQKVVPSKAVFSSNQEQITKNFERISKPASFSKVIESKDSRNIMKSEISDVKELRKGSKNFDHRTGKLKFNDILQFQPNEVSESSVLENEQKTEEAAFKLPKTVYTDGESMLDESNDEQSKFKDNEIYKYTENKEMTAQSEETHFEEAPKMGFDSINKASEKENYVTGTSSNDVIGNKVSETGEVANSDIEITEADNTAYRTFETSESNDANFKPEGTKILKKKRTIQIFKGKANELSRKVGSDGSAIQKSTDSNIVHKIKVGPIKIGRNDGTELKTKNYGVDSGRSLITSKPKKQRQIKAAKVPIISLEKKQYFIE